MSAGTTLAALEQPGFVGTWVVAIEGYKFLLTDGPAAAAVAAWAGTDWSSALEGLYVELDHQQTANPWDSFQGGGSCTIRVQPDVTDQLGIDAHRKSAGAETLLSAIVNRTATTIPVLSTTGFATSGEAFIGTECFAYTGVTGTSFTTVTRGRYSPFGAAATTHFAEHHRVGFDSLQVQLQPTVSQQPRSWVGKWVGIWLHRNVGGVLDVQAQAQLVAAGKIVEIRDDANTGYTSIEVKDLLDVVKDTMLGRDMFRCAAPEGTYLAAGRTFGLDDSINSGASWFTANPLIVLASGASGPNQCNAGYYTLSDICNTINAWLANENISSRIAGTYSMASPVTGSGTDLHTKIYWRCAVGSAVDCNFRMQLPGEIGGFLGFSWGSPGQSSGTNVEIRDIGQSDTDLRKESDYTPWRTFIFSEPDGRDVQFNFAGANTGTLVDQYALLPTWTGKPTTAGGGGWGVFLLNDDFPFFGKFSLSSPTEITNIVFVPTFQTDAVLWQTFRDNRGWGVRADAGDTASISVRQLYVLEGTFETLINTFFFGTGTTSYNDATDTLGFGLGLGLPAALLPNFKASVAAIPGKDALLDVIIDQPTKISDLMGGDFMLRRAFPRWKNGGLELATFQAPTVAAAVVTLTENNKAAPANNVNNLRTASTLTSAFQKSIIKLNYNRDVTKFSSSDGDYGSSLTFEDRVAVDDAGGDANPFTINASNTFSQFVATGAGVETLAPAFLATMPLFSRPVRMITRSIAPTLFEQISIGDIVAVTDAFARDPGTGRRSITARPGMILRVRWNYGGPTAGQPTKVNPMVGEADVYFLDINRIAAYAPCAKLDETVSTGGFDHGYASATSTIRCHAHEHSEAAEPLDASNFATGDKIVIVEIDPASAAAPTTWSRTVQSVSTNDIVLTAGLASPAFDNTKTYRVLSDHFAVAQATQQVKAYQALSTAALIESVSSPDQYGHAPVGQPFTAGGPSDLPELAAIQSYGDGKPYDVGYDRGLGRLVNNLLDFKTSKQSPMLSQTICGNYTYALGTGLQIVMMAPIFLSKETTSTQALRRLWVAPWFRSTTGISVGLVVSLCREMPTDDTLNDPSLGSVFSSALWTTSSTTWGIGTEQALQIAVKNQGTGLAFLVIECSEHCETRGLAQCVERNRVP